MIRDVIAAHLKFLIDLLRYTEIASKTKSTLRLCAREIDDILCILLARD